MNEEARLGILFACYANICRSPLAEAVFRSHAQRAGLADALRIDSAGSQGFPGSPPHPHSVEAGRKFGHHVTGQSRQLHREDLCEFHLIVVMDRQVLRQIERLAQPSAFGPLEGFRAKLALLSSFTDSGTLNGSLDLSDPIGDDQYAYLRCCALIESACPGLIRWARDRLPAA